jgi:hypothetical protein
LVHSPISPFHVSPKFIAPRHIGETLIEAEGLRTLWYARSDGTLVLVAKDMFVFSTRSLIVKMLIIFPIARRDTDDLEVGYCRPRGNQLCLYIWNPSVLAPVKPTIIPNSAAVMMTVPLHYSSLAHNMPRSAM